MTLLLTGARGFIGKALLPVLESVGHQVWSLVRPGTGGLGNSWIEADLTRELDCSRLPRPVDTVIHLAQSPHYREFPSKALDVFSVNCEATLALLDFAKNAGASKFILASTGSIYRRSSAPLWEDAPKDPRDFYSISKLVAELLTESYRKYFEVITARFFCVYGPNQKDRMIPNLINKVKNGKTVTLTGKEGVRMNPLYVDDAAEIIVRLLDVIGSHKLNVAGDKPYSVRQMASLIGEVVGRKPVFEAGGPEEGDLVSDLTALYKLLRFRPRISFTEGIRRTVVDV